MKKRYIILLIYLSGIICHLQAQQSESLNNGWNFQRISDEKIQHEIKNQGSDWEAQFNISHISQDSELSLSESVVNDELSILKAKTWEAVTIPHTPFVEDLTVLHQWQGVCYYRKSLDLNPTLKGKNIWIEFEGAMTLADIWVNGEHIQQNAGGYLPFVVDISNVAHFNKPNEILVRLDNRDNPLIPPGKPLNSLDFCYYGGLYRDVNLIIKDQNYITHPIKTDKVARGGIFVTYPEVSKEQATIRIQTDLVQNRAGNTSLVHKIYEINGLFTDHKLGKKIIEETQTLSNSAEILDVKLVKVQNPKLWSPSAPNLYLIETELIENGKVIDREETRIGIRHLEMNKEKGFCINGEPLRLVGSNRHMEYPYIGNAISDNAQYRDIYQIRENGFNTVRLGHYPQDESVLDACDELGILAIEPIPGWQFFNSNETFINLTYRDVRAMIRRDRNHPSVIMWEVILNESWPPNEWKDKVNTIAHEEYPGDQCFTAGDAYGYDGFDVSYNDWAEGFNRKNSTQNPSFIREYYDFEFGGHYSSTRKKRGDGEAALLNNAWNAQWSHNRYRAYYPATMGDAVWSMYDYNRGCCDNICYSGVADIFRLPKFSLNFFRSQIPVGEPQPNGEMKPYVSIANFWTERDDSNKQVVVYGNVDEVELLVNGVVVAKQKKDGGSDSEYSKDQKKWYTGGEPFDGGNCKNITEAPFTFNNITWQAGEIEAIGYINGKAVTKEVVKSPMKASSIEISYFESGKKLSRNDIAIVYVSIVDKNGTLVVTDNETEITLSVEGGTILSPTQINAEAGIASFVVQTNGSKRIEFIANSSSFTKKMSLRLL